MVEENGHRPLSKRTIFYYGLSEMPLQVASVVISAYLLNYYATDLGVGSRRSAPSGWLRASSTASRILSSAI